MLKPMQTKKKGRPRKQKIVFSFNDIKLRALRNNRPVMFYFKDIYSSPFILVTGNTDRELCTKMKEMKGNRDPVFIMVANYELGRFCWTYDSRPVELKSAYNDYKYTYIGQHFRFFAKTYRRDVNSLDYCPPPYKSFRL